MKRQQKLMLAVILIGWPAMAGVGPGVTLRVVNMAKAPERSVLCAETVAGEILSRAGVGTVWLNCGDAAPVPDRRCDRALDPNEYWVRVVAGKPRDRSRGALGWSVLDGPEEGGVYATMSYRMLSNAADSAQVAVFEVLGAAMAHEIGHLLLGAKHSPDGVMSTLWGEAQYRRVCRGELRFTPEQGVRMRAAIVHRMNEVASAVAGE